MSASPGRSKNKSQLSGRFASQLSASAVLNVGYARAHVCKRIATASSMMSGAIVALADWWKEHRKRVCCRLVGASRRSRTKMAKWPPESLEGMLKKLEEASQKAEPLDKIATLLERRQRDCDREWQDINTEQKMREAVAEVLEATQRPQEPRRCRNPSLPFESLSSRVSVQSLTTSASKTDSNFGEHGARKASGYGPRPLQPRTIRSTLDFVANASWLRAILWAFVFAMREEAIEDLGGCAFPLMVLDDPQLTFDPKNKTKMGGKNRGAGERRSLTGK